MEWTTTGPERFGPVEKLVTRLVVRFRRGHMN